MTLDEIRALISASGRDDWSILSGDAPTYIGRQVERSAEGVRWQEVVGHDQRGVLKRDIDVGLAWGMTASPYDDDPAEPLWAQSFQDKRVHPHVVEILCRGQPVHREVYAGIDNGHGVVPWPHALSGSDVLAATSWQYDLTVLVRELGGAVGVQSVEQYMDRCGITTVG